MIKIERSGSASGSISQRHGSADPDPDPHQNVMDLQHWKLATNKLEQITVIQSLQYIALFDVIYPHCQKCNFGE
jgi:hypothetical protein